LDTYLDAIKDIPKGVRFLQTKAGAFDCIKTDIFKKTMWFQLRRKEAGGGENPTVALHVDQVRELLEQINKGTVPDSLSGFAPVEEKTTEAEPDYEVNVGGGLNRFDRPKNKNRKKKRPKPKGPGPAPKPATP
jgi:hypothetical protein